MPDGSSSAGNGLRAIAFKSLAIERPCLDTAEKPVLYSEDIVIM